MKDGFISVACGTPKLRLADCDYNAEQTFTMMRAAEKAGVRVGDFIVSAAGAEVTSSQDLLRIRRQFHVGDELPLTLWREGEQLEVTLVLQGAGDSGS